MALKTLRIDATLDERFLIETTIGNHCIRMDQPVRAAGQDLGPSPLEMAMAALAGCFGTVARFIAHQRRLDLRGMQMQMEADYDPDALLGRRDDIRPGFEDMRLVISFEGDLSPEQQVELLAEIERRCPLADNLLHGTRISTRIA